jgi:hypothetical protein
MKHQHPLSRLTPCRSFIPKPLPPRTVDEIFIKPPKSRHANGKRSSPMIANHLLKPSTLAARWAHCPANSSRIGPGKSKRSVYVRTVASAVINTHIHPFTPNRATEHILGSFFSTVACSHTHAHAHTHTRSRLLRREVPFVCVESLFHHNNVSD